MTTVCRHGEQQCEQQSIALFSVSLETGIGLFHLQDLIISCVINHVTCSSQVLLLCIIYLQRLHGTKAHNYMVPNFSEAMEKTFQAEQLKPYLSTN